MGYIVSAVTCPEKHWNIISPLLSLLAVVLNIFNTWTVQKPIYDLALVPFPFSMREGQGGHSLLTPTCNLSTDHGPLSYSTVIVDVISN